MSARRARLRMSGLLLGWLLGSQLGSLLGCSREPALDCSAPTDSPTRDRCAFEAMSTAAAEARTADAVALAYSIEDPLLRGAAIQVLVAENPPGLDVPTMTALCATLPELPAQRCTQQWSRPHLWKQPE